MPRGGRGVLLGGVPGVEPANVDVIGGGIVCINAAKMACGLGAKVYLIDINLDRLRYLSDIMPSNCFPVMYSAPKMRELLAEADLVIGAVLLPGAKAPKLVTRDMLKVMKKEKTFPICASGLCRWPCLIPRRRTFKTLTCL